MDQIQIRHTDTLRLIGYTEIRAVQLRISYYQVQ